MAVTDPDCPFNLAHRLGLRIIGSTEPMPVPVLYVAEHHLAIVSPGFGLEDYELAADWLLSEAVQQSVKASH